MNDYFKKINSILGILSNETIKLDEEIKQLIRERDEAREKKDWNKSDKIRDKLLKRGYVVEDTEKGTRIKRNQE